MALAQPDCEVEAMKYNTGAVRNTGGKGRCDLLPACSLLRIAKHMENSLSNYPERNWEKGLPMHSMIDSAMRHILKYIDGQTDEDHLAAAATNLLMALWTEEKKPDMQDIPTRGRDLSIKISNKDKICPYCVDGMCFGVKEPFPCEGGEYTRCDTYEES